MILRVSAVLAIVTCLAGACAGRQQTSPNTPVPPGILLFENAPDFDHIRQRSSPELESETEWGDRQWTRARPSPDHQLVVARDATQVPHLLSRSGEALTVLDDSVDCPFFTSNREFISFGPVSDEGFASLRTWEIAETAQERMGVRLVSQDGSYGGFPSCPVLIGGHLAYTTDDGVVVDAAQISQPVLVSDCTSITFVRPSSDNLLPILARCDSAEDSGLYELDIGSGEVRQVVSGFLAAPTYSRDGTLIFFARTRGATCCQPLDIWVSKRDGSEQRRLLEGASWPVLLEIALP